jgi:hypothetical protein
MVPLFASVYANLGLDAPRQRQEPKKFSATASIGSDEGV